MNSARTAAIVILALTFLFNEWAFRFIFPLEPIDSFLRLLTLVLDAFLSVPIIMLLLGRPTVSAILKHFMQQHHRKLTLYIGLFLSFCMVMAVEFSCRFYFKHIYEAPYSGHTYWEPRAIVPDSILGSKLQPDAVISHAYIVNDSLIYKQHYRTDGFGRRISPPVHPDSSYREFAMVTGGSFAFGYGLDEHQTLAYHIDSLTGYRGYNYGVAGHGTQQTLALLQSRDLYREIKEPNGVLIHLFIDAHIARLIGSRRLIKLWARNYPYYHIEDGRPERDGSFLSGRHLLTRFYHAISQSAFIDLFGIDIPWYVSRGHLELFGAVLREAKREFRSQYPGGRFIVVIGPGSRLATRIRHVLHKNGVEVLDLSDLLDRQKKQYRIHWTEAHPNGRYYLEVAQAIIAHLRPE